MTYKLNNNQLEDIKYKYITLNMSTKEIGNVYNIPRYIILKRLKNLGIEVNNLRVIKYTVEELIYKYVTQEYSIKEIAEDCYCDQKVIRRILLNHNIKIRGNLEAVNTNRNINRLKLSLRGIKKTAEQIEKNRISHLGHIVDVESRIKRSKTQKGRYKVRLNLEDIVHKYYDLQLTTVDIAVDYNCAPITVAKRLKDAGYKLRDRFSTAKTEITKNKIKSSTIGQKRPSVSGENNPMWHKHPNPETIEKIKAARKRQVISKESILKIAEKLRLKWANSSPEYKSEMLRKRSLATIVKPNKPENCMITILNELYPNEWKYTGDGKIRIEGLNPDFMNINGQKKIIECYGLYWHGVKARTYNRTVEGRKEIFAKYGYDTLIIWENEFKDRNSVIDKVIAFNGENNRPKCEVQGKLL